MTSTELMLGLSLLGLMGSVGLAQGLQVLLDQRLESATRLLAQGLQRARREAPRRGAPCGLRLSATGWTIPPPGTLPPCFAAPQPLPEGVAVAHNFPELLRFTANGLLPSVGRRDGAAAILFPTPGRYWVAVDSGLDPINQDVLEQIVRDYHAKGTTILFSTHLMDQAERLCERVCLISKSKKVLDGDLREIKASERRGIVAVEFEGSDDWIHGPEIDRVEDVGRGLQLVLHDGASHQPILHRAVAAGVNILRFDLVEPRLHEIFVRHAGDAAVGDAGMPTLTGSDHEVATSSHTSGRRGS